MKNAVDFYGYFRYSFKRTGLATDLMLDDSGSYIKERMPKHILFQANPKERDPLKKIYAYMNFKGNIINTSKKDRIDLSPDEIEDIRKFVKSNEVYLDLLCDGKIDCIDFFKKVELDR